MNFPSMFLLVYENHTTSFWTLNGVPQIEQGMFSFTERICASNLWALRLYVFAAVCPSTLKFAQVFLCIQIIPVIKLTENMLVKAQNISTVPSKHNLNRGNILHKNNQLWPKSKMLKFILRQLTWVYARYTRYLLDHGVLDIPLADQQASCNPNHHEHL